MAASDCNAILSFVIPCYASAGSVGYVVDEIRDKMSERDDFDYQIVTVCDCSPDDVYSVVRSLAAQDEKITCIDLAKNVGRHNALMCGLRYAHGDYIVFVDDDQQCPVDKLWDLMNPLLEGDFDVSFARYPRKVQSKLKNFGSMVNDRVSTWLLGKDRDLKFSNFCAMKRFVRDEIIKYSNPYPFLSGLMLRTTNRVCNVDMEERARVIGTGNYTFRKSVALWLNSFTSFSVKPLRIAAFLGLFFAAVGGISAVVVIVRKLLIPEIALGYSSTMATLLFIGGLIMLLLGLMGEYLGRIYISINCSPQYVIRDITKHVDSDESEAEQEIVSS